MNNSSEFDFMRQRNGLTYFQIGIGITIYFIILALAYGAVAQPVVGHTSALAFAS